LTREYQNTFGDKPVATDEVKIENESDEQTEFISSIFLLNPVGNRCEKSFTNRTSDISFLSDIYIDEECQNGGSSWKDFLCSDFFETRGTNLREKKTNDSLV
jgi:hypothetical protein